MEFLQALTEYEYLRKALITALLVGVQCGVVGSFTVLRGLALMGDAVSHAVLPGIAASFLLGIGFFPGALAAGLLTAFGIGYINQRSKLKNDAVIGIVFTTMFALGVVMISLSPSSTDLTKILFGNVLAVRPADMWMTVIVGALVILTVVALYKEFQVSSFDPTMAATYGLSTKTLHHLLMTLLTLVAVASLQTVGVILVVAMLIIPASTAFLLTERLPVMIGLSACFGMVAAAGGLYLSFTYNLPSGAAIVLVGSALFICAFLGAPKQGIISRAIVARRTRTAAAV
ncbi:metal ABC transporter permease [Jonesiaceae bacterium BS-20]|uniref:Metal ABC transporter permease n=1 Tax=Jonesiaceae bacterium BS-20 TaxID=3120821 RepID=A0AAU7DVI7_9MICO